MAIEQINIKIIDRYENDRVLEIEQTQIGSPVLTYNGADDKYQSIMASEFKFNLSVPNFEDGKFFHLYTGNEKRYYVLVEDAVGNMIFEGFLLPDFYSEPFHNSVLFVELTATDGLALLKGRFLENKFYKKETSVIELIAECLKQTKLVKEIYFSPAIESAAVNYRWDEIAVDGASYLGDGEIKNMGFLFGEILPSPKNSYEILDLLLVSLGCTLYQKADKWHIEGINRKNELYQEVQVYSYLGKFITTAFQDKETQEIVFFSSPTVSIKSPWKSVKVNWDLEEDGNLVPEWALLDLSETFGERIDMFNFWKTNGGVTFSSLNKDAKNNWTNMGAGGGFVVSILDGTPDPKHLRVGFAPTFPVTEANYRTKYFDFIKKQYLKVTDDELERDLKVELKIKSVSEYTTSSPSPKVEPIENKYFPNTYRFEVLSGDAPVVSSISTNTGLIKKVIPEKSGPFYNESFPLIVGESFEGKAYTLDSELEVETKIPSNGFLNCKFYPPVLAGDIWYYSYVISSLIVEYTAMKTWLKNLIRNIDFSTSYDLDIFHSDEKQDLSKKQFRFRRPVFANLPSSGAIVIISSEVASYLTTVVFTYVINSADALKITTNTDLLVVNYGGQQIYIKDLLNYSNYEWHVNEGSGGNYELKLYANLIDHPSGIGSFVSDFFSMEMASGIVFQNYETEDNEWRESWRRKFTDESIRYGEALGKIYHDVYPEALVCLEGDATTLIFPGEISRFKWIESREFIPTRVTIDFTKGRTNVFLLESKNQKVIDYVN